MLAVSYTLIQEIFLLYIQVGTSPSVMVFDDMEMNYDKRTEWVSPSFSNEVFERSGVEKVKKTVLRRRIKKSTLTSRCSSLCSCSSWSESSLLLQRSLWQTLPLSNPLGKNRSLLFFLVKMSTLADVDGVLLKSSTKVGNALLFFWLPCWILLGNSSWKNVLLGLVLHPSPPSQIQATYQSGRGSSIPPDLGNARK